MILVSKRKSNQVEENYHISHFLGKWCLNETLNNKDVGYKINIK